MLFLSSPFTVSNNKRNSKRRTQNPSTSLKKPLLRQKNDAIPSIGKVIQRLFNIDLYTYLAIHRFR